MHGQLRVCAGHAARHDPHPQRVSPARARPLTPRPQQFKATMKDARRSRGSDSPATRGVAWRCMHRGSRVCRDASPRRRHGWWLCRCALHACRTGARRPGAEAQEGGVDVLMRSHASLPAWHSPHYGETAQLEHFMSPFSLQTVHLSAPKRDSMLLRLPPHLRTVTYGRHRRQRTIRTAGTPCRHTARTRRWCAPRSAAARDMVAHAASAGTCVLTSMGSSRPCSFSSLILAWFCAGDGCGDATCTHANVLAVKEELRHRRAGQPRLQLLSVVRVEKHVPARRSPQLMLNQRTAAPLFERDAAILQQSAQLRACQCRAHHHRHACLHSSAVSAWIHSRTV